MDELIGASKRGLLVAAVLSVLVPAIAAAAGLAGGPLAATIVFDILVFYAAVQAYNLFCGLTGYLSFGHGAIFGAGGYAALALAASGVPPAAAAVIGGLLAGIIMALPFAGLTRARGPYFAVATLALFIAARVLASLIPGLGGSTGIFARSLAVAPSLALAAGVAAASTLALVLLASRRVGLRVLAVRDAEEAAKSLGINPAVYRFALLLASSVLTALAGAVWFASYGYIDPSLAFAPQGNLEIVLAAVAGGLGSLTGPVMGSLVVRGIRYAVITYAGPILSLLGVPSAMVSRAAAVVETLLLGSLVVLIVLAAPRGLYGLLLERRFHRVTPVQAGSLGGGGAGGGGAEGGH